MRQGLLRCGRVPGVTRLVRKGWVLFAALILAPLPLHAQVAQQRLSDWLLEQAHQQDDYPLGLSWRVPGEMAAQNELRSALLKNLSGQDHEVKADPEALHRLREWVGILPVTGRVPVSKADARWLQANPSRDPVILPDHIVVLPRRPRTVTVVTASGERCHVVHSAGREALAYVDACSPQSSQQADWAWVVQPDGKVRRYGVSAWNLEMQDEPAPGAWIWAPQRDGGWPEQLSSRLAAFLSTQGPAPDSSVEASAATDAPSLVGADTQASPALFLSPDKIYPEPSRNSEVMANDWGEAGLLQSPSARMRKAGDFSFNLSRTFPYTRANVFAQPFDWLEVGFRYTDIANRPYGSVSFSGHQTFKDKSIDVKLGLVDESAYEPQVAIGLRDLAGTGLFSGEYLVASKRTGDLDWNFGLGWGYAGGRGNLRNPLGRLAPSFDKRPGNTVTTGGTLAFNSYFRGRTALFGGVQYQSPWEPLILKLEYDGNDYQHEPLGNNLPKKSPWNFGATYRVADSLNLSFGLERGNKAMFGITLHSQLDRAATPKLDDPARVAVAVGRPQQNPDWAITGRAITQQTDWHVRSMAQRGDELRVAVDDADVVYWRDYVNRAAAVLHRDAPASVNRFTLAYREHGVEVAEHVIDRDAWVAQQTQPLPPSERRDPVRARAPVQEDVQAGQKTPYYRDALPAFEARPGMDTNFNIGGPDGFVLFQVAATEKAKLRLRDNTWLQGGVQLGLIDNFNKFRFAGFSNLPRVRTYLREYMTARGVTMPNLQLTHVGRLGENQYYSVYAGYLEWMFAGAGGEWLYRPFASQIALGVDVNAVRQRDFAQDFGLRDYRVNTGHVTLYWDTGWNNVQANLSAGRYLAGDKGVTVAMSRVFQNGVSLGAFFSKTNVSQQQFGEGSFDKGMYLRIPLDAMLTHSSGLVSSFAWSPLTRDGGAKLNRAVTLFGETQLRDGRALYYEPAQHSEHGQTPSERRDDWYPASGN